MNCVILGSYVTTPEQFVIAKQTWDIIIKLYSDCKIIVGINPPFLSEWIKLIQSSNLDVDFVVTPNYLTIDSEASAILRAINYYKIQGYLYDNIFLGHTKSVVSQNIELLNLVINKFWKQKDYMLNILSDNSEISGVFPFSFYNSSQAATKLIKYCSGDKLPLPFVAAHGFMLLRGKEFNMFTHSLSESLFNEKITNLNFDRYLLERELATIPSMYGKNVFPMCLFEHGGEKSTIKRYKNLMNEKKFNIKNFQIKKNNKEILIKYIF